MHIKIEEERKIKLGSFGGLPVFKKILEKIELKSQLEEFLPKSPKLGLSGYCKFEALSLGLISGASCLDDMAVLSRDEGFGESTKVHAANSYGNFLRGFTEGQCRNLNNKLIETSLKLRTGLNPRDKDFILDLDSTSHVQYGQKMEGVSVNHKGEECLDSLEAFDNYGFQYWMEVRPGATFTSNGSAEVIDAVFRRANQHVFKNRYLRADSGFCNSEVFHASRVAGVKFVTAMRENMFGSLDKTVSNWSLCKKIKFRDGRECEIGHTVYITPDKSQTLRVVVIRAKSTRNSMFTEYDYHAWVTNLGQHEMQDEKVILFYRKRGNAENFIRELKNGFDLKHFPCQKLLANRAYGLIAAFAYTVTRFVALLKNPLKPRFAKRLRFEILNLCVRVVKHAGRVSFRYQAHHYLEVQRLLQLIHIKFSGFQFSASSPPFFDN